jgi:hypothetical protein
LVSQLPELLGQLEDLQKSPWELFVLGGRLASKLVRI